MSVKGEKYKSAAAMKMHEKNEPMSMRMKEYGVKKAVAKKAVKKAVVKKAVMKKMGKKK